MSATKAEPGNVAAGSNASDGNASGGNASDDNPSRGHLKGGDRLRIAVAGASGRMGRMLIRAVMAAPDMVLSAALDRAGSDWIGRDAADDGSAGVLITDNLDEGLRNAQVLIDFTQPAATLAHTRACEARGVALVIGTTGLDADDRASIESAAQRIPILLSPNMSVGVNVMLALVDQATRALASECDIEVIEAHHRHKVDAPSGTALKIAEVIAHAQNRELDDVATWTRHGHTGPRLPGTIGFSVIRGGDIVGDHTVYYAGTGERIEITHRSSSRETYAQGSLRGCRFLVERRNGLFSMADVLGLRPQHC